MKKMSALSAALFYKLSKYNFDPILLLMSTMFHIHHYFLILFNCIFEAISIFK